MRLREHEGVQTKRDAFSFDPRLLKADDGYNVRDLSTPEARAKLAELKEQIRHAGVRTPLEVRMKGEDVLIVAGHRRHRAVMELIEEGVEIKSVPVLQEPSGTSQEERTLNLALSNSGEPLTQMEVAHVVKRLCDFGWDHGKIAERMGWKSKNSVAQHLDMLALTPDLQAAIKQGKIAATTARKSVAEIGAEATAKIIADNEVQGKRTRPRDLPAKAKKTKAKQSAKDEMAARADYLSKAVAHSPAELLSAGAARSSALNGFHAAIEPFAKALEHTNWDEVADDGVLTIDIMGRDAKLFIQAWTRATGDAS